MEEFNQTKSNNTKFENPKVENGQEDQSSQSPKKDGSVGPVVGSMIVILIIIIGGIYYFNKSVGNQKEPAETEAIAEDEVINEKELNEIDEALQDIENEIDEAVNQQN